MSAPATLLFVSPRFLFPVDSGGKIRTTQILRGMKGGRFRIRLMSPATPELAARHREDLARVCDEFEFWPTPADGWRGTLHRAWHMFDPLPMPVRVDRSDAAAAAVGRALEARPDVVVFDFLHAAVLAPPGLDTPSVIFTHNVEAQIFARHLEVARSAAMRVIWRNQLRKMRAYEARTLARFDVVVAVSAQDSRLFERDYGVRDAHVIPTGVDLDFFRHAPPSRDAEIVFCGSMDWLANQGAMRYFMDEVWAAIVARVPGASMTVVGRAPPASLVAEAARRQLRWRFTGFVDDVRPIVGGAAVSVVPLQVGGGTRLKVFESMAMGPVVVSTTIGVEGLPVESGLNCVVADDAQAMAEAVVALLGDRERRHVMSRAARHFVEENCGHVVAARCFENACLDALNRNRRS
ncbi:MAG: glycosyltransferase [Steroidobacteraceae bacterium]